MMKCSRETGFCKTLLNRLENVNHRGKGFSPVMVVKNLNTKKVDMECIGVKYSTSGKDKGVMLNVCPFCMAPLTWHKEDK